MHRFAGVHDAIAREISLLTLTLGYRPLLISGRIRTGSSGRREAGGALLLAVNSGDDGMAEQADGSPERRKRSEDSRRPPGGADDPLLGLPAIWLRDNCGCAECRDPGSRARLTSITDLSERVSIAAVHRRGHRIEIEFAPDRHHSVYDARWLDQFRPAPVPRQRSQPPVRPPPGPVRHRPGGRGRPQRGRQAPMGHRRHLRCAAAGLLAALPVRSRAPAGLPAGRAARRLRAAGRHAARTRRGAGRGPDPGRGPGYRARPGGRGPGRGVAPVRGLHQPADTGLLVRPRSGIRC